jgi:hypothetical protein
MRNVGMLNSIEQLENGTVTDKIIEIKSIYKNGKTTVQPVRDPMSGWYKGIKRLSENDKRDLRFWAEPNTKFTLKEGVILDLNKEEHRVIWEWLKFQPCLAMSYEQCQARPEAEFYVHLQHKEAEKSISRKKIKFQAMKYITEDNASNYPLRVKLLGINMDGEDPVVIENFLLERAESEPSKVIKLYEDKLLSLRMLLMEAVEKRKVIIEPSGAYRYGNMFLGMNEDSALDWMNSTENKSVVRLLEEEVNPEYFREEVVEEEEEDDFPIDITTSPKVEEPVEKPVAKKTTAKKTTAKKTTTRKTTTRKTAAKK